MFDDVATRCFDTLGYVLQPRLLDTDAVETVRAWLDDIQAKGPGEARDMRYYESSVLDGDARVLIRIECFLDDYPDLSGPLLTAALLGRVEQLMREHVVLFKDKVNFKLPGARADTMHYDHAGGWAPYATRFLTVAIAIDPNRADNAAMRFVRNGDLRARLRQEPVRRLHDGAYADEPQELLLLDPGDAVFFDSFVPHASPPNLGTAPRRNVLLTFSPAREGDQRRRYYDALMP